MNQTHICSFSGGEMWMATLGDGERVVQLSWGAPENAVSLTLDDLDLLAQARNRLALEVRLQSADRLANTEAHDAGKE